MGRCISLFSLMFFALGVVALTSGTKDEAPNRLPAGPPAPPSGTPRTAVPNTPRYLVQFSLN